MRDRALKNDPPAAPAWFRADLDDVIRGADQRFLMFDGDDRVAGVGQRSNDGDEPVDIARVQADAWLVEHEQRVREGCPEAGREVDALDFAARKRFGGAIEGQIVEADLLQVAKAGHHGLMGEAGVSVAGPGASGNAGEAGVPGGEQGKQLADGQRIKFGQGAAPPLPAERIRLQPAAAADGAGIIGAKPRQKHPHVHLVGVFFHPAEKPLHAIPAARPGLAVFPAVAGFAVDDVVFLRRREIGERHVGRDFFLFCEGAQVLQRLAVDLALPAPDGSPVDGPGLVGNRETRVDLDHTAKPAALGAGAERRIERKQRRRRGAKNPAGRRRMQAAGVAADLGEARRCPACRRGPARPGWPRTRAGRPCHLPRTETRPPGRSAGRSRPTRENGRGFRAGWRCDPARRTGRMTSPRPCPSVGSSSMRTASKSAVSARV